MNPIKDTLPLLGKTVLWFFLNDDDYYQAIGDFEEAYRDSLSLGSPNLKKQQKNKNEVIVIKF
jgi:hypothetical protein